MTMLPPEYIRRSWRLWRAYQRGDLGPLAYAWLHTSLRRYGAHWRVN